MIRIQGTEKLKDKLRILYSPLTDLVMAMDLLCHPENRKLHSSWTNSVLSSLTQKEKEQLHKYEEILNGYLDLDLNIDFLNFPFEKALQPGICSAYIGDSGNWRSPLSDQQMKEMTSFLSFMWDSYIYPVVKEHVPAIKNQLSEGNEILKKDGYQDLFRKVNDRVSFTRTGEIKIDKWVESSFDTEDLESFNLELSLFSFPRMVISDRHEEGSFWLSWDVPFRDDKIIAPGIDRISTKAFALSDKSRLRILLMLSDQAMTQKELTRQMGFAKSTISRHINILLDAEIIVPEDGERNVLLKLNKKALGRFSSEIARWLS